MTNTEEAAGLLLRLERMAEEARAVLLGLQRDIAEAENHLEGSAVAQLVAVNEQLMLSVLRAQTDAETATQALDDVARSAELDPLTGLANRSVMLDRLTQAIAAAKRHDTRLAVLFLDLDNFKLINDTLGHAAGDQALQLAARCLVSSVRAADTVSRHGGDEFVILLTEVGRASDAELIADKVIAALGAPCRIDKHPMSLKASVGISIYPDHGLDAAALIDCADKAMYSAKKQRLGCVLFRNDDQAQQPAPKARATVSGDPLRAGMDEDNASLVLAAANAQALQATAERAYRRQMERLVLVADALRNSTQPIRAATDLLGQQRLDDTALLRIKTLVERQLGHMEHLVTDLLDVSRVHAGKL